MRHHRRRDSSGTSTRRRAGRAPRSRRLRWPNERAPDHRMRILWRPGGRSRRVSPPLRRLGPRGRCTDCGISLWRLLEERRTPLADRRGRRPQHRGGARRFPPVELLACHRPLLPATAGVMPRPRHARSRGRPSSGPRRTTRSARRWCARGLVQGHQVRFLLQCLSLNLFPQVVPLPAGLGVAAAFGSASP